jgi:hypothetical protein
MPRQIQSASRRAGAPNQVGAQLRFDTDLGDDGGLHGSLWCISTTCSSAVSVPAIHLPALHQT